jgi:hypothetical protein
VHFTPGDRTARHIRSIQVRNQVGGALGHLSAFRSRRAMSLTNQSCSVLEQHFVRPVGGTQIRLICARSPGLGDLRASRAESAFGVTRGEQTFTPREIGLYPMTTSAARRSFTEPAKPAKIVYSHCYVRAP